jgi:hypothetical protein
VNKTGQVDLLMTGFYPVMFFAVMLVPDSGDEPARSLSIPSGPTILNTTYE